MVMSKKKKIKLNSRPHSLVVRIKPLPGFGLGANPGGVIWEIKNVENVELPI